MSFFSIAQYTGNGATQLYAVPFPYINQTDVVVTVAGVVKVFGTDFTWPSSTSISFTVAPLNLAAIQFTRQTGRAVRGTVFQDASVLPATSLNSDSNQLFYITQEVLDATIQSLSKNTLAVWDALGSRITNGADGVAPTDFVTVEQLAAAALAPVPLPLATTSGGTGGSYSNFAALVVAIKALLGSAAALNVGTAVGNVVQLDVTTGKLPAVDGSLLTGIAIPKPFLANQFFPTF